MENDSRHVAEITPIIDYATRNSKKSKSRRRLIGKIALATGLAALVTNGNVQRKIGLNPFGLAGSGLPVWEVGHSSYAATGYNDRFLSVEISCLKKYLFCATGYVNDQNTGRKLILMNSRGNYEFGAGGFLQTICTGQNEKEVDYKWNNKVFQLFCCSPNTKNSEKLNSWVRSRTATSKQFLT